MVPVEAGTVVGGKYALLRPLGRGSMGEVWVAQHKTLGEEVAIKLLAPAVPGEEYEDRSTAAARFRFEAQIAARLSRKTRHIVRVTDYGDEDGVAYLVMELLVGRTLEMFFMQYGSMTFEAVGALVRQVARALDHAHAESVVHRDLKPANLFVTHDEEGGMLVKVLDFGIARTIRTQRVSIPSAFSTGQGLVFGTPGYMSPEQARAARMDARTDLWAFATVIYEALTGELPLAGVTADELVKNLCAGITVPVHERDPNLPAGLADFFARAFAPNIDDRFATAPELAAAFDRALHTPSALAPTTALPAALPSAAAAPTLVSRSGSQRASAASGSAQGTEPSTWTAAGTLEMPRVKTSARSAPKGPTEPAPVRARETSPWPRRAWIGAAFAAMAAAGLLFPARYASRRGLPPVSDPAQHADVLPASAALAPVATPPPEPAKSEPPVASVAPPSSAALPPQAPAEAPQIETAEAKAPAPQPIAPAVRSRPAPPPVVSSAPPAPRPLPTPSAGPSAAPGSPIDRSAIL